MDERVIIAIVYIAACVAITVIAPQYASLFIAAVNPIITYYFVKKELFKHAGERFEDLISAIMEIIVYMSLIALALVIFIFTYLYIVMPIWR
jgi:hypothetical protein